MRFKIAGPDKRPSRHPFEVWLLGGLGLAGLSQLLNGPNQASVTAHVLTPHAQLLLSICLMVGSFVALIGAYWRNALASRFIEIAGLVGLGIALGTYSWVLLSLVPNWSSVPGVMFVVGMFIACLHRGYQAAAWLVAVYKRGRGE